MSLDGSPVGDGGYVRPRSKRGVKRVEGAGIGCIDLMTLVGGGTEIPHDRRGRKYIPHTSQMDTEYVPRILTRVTRPITPSTRKPDRKMMVSQPQDNREEAVPRGKMHLEPEIAVELKWRGKKVMAREETITPRVTMDHLSRDEYSEVAEMGRKKREIRQRGVDGSACAASIRGPNARGGSLLPAERPTMRLMKFEYLDKLYRANSELAMTDPRKTKEHSYARRTDDTLSAQRGQLPVSRPMSAIRTQAVERRLHEERASVHGLSSWVPPAPAFLDS